MNTTLEMALSESSGIPITQIIMFGSKTLPIISVAITVDKPVDLFCGNEPFPFTQENLDLLANLHIHLNQHAGAPEPKKGHVTLALEAARNGVDVDGVVGKFVLYIRNPTAIDPHDIFVIRKRFATPITNPMSEEWMQQLAGVSVTANQGTYTPESLADFYGHLQTMSGTAVNTGANPVIFTAGLSALCSTWFTMIDRGGCNVLMASTAYGGCSELTDLISKFAPEKFSQTRYDVQGASQMIDSIRLRLDELAADPANLKPTTVLLSEIPTNPDMKVPDIKALAETIMAYKKKTGKGFVMITDTTFAPGSRVLEKFEKYAPGLSAMVFVSMSKSVSRGKTTAGAIICNKEQEAIEILDGVRKVSSMLDTNAKQDQLCFLCENHHETEKRCLDAYAIHTEVGDHLVKLVKDRTGFDMPLCTVSPENAKEGFTSSTFSFNLPSPDGATKEDLDNLAQKFVDLLCENKNFKPCVSFGQDNGLTYCTVPATSTQGAIKEEDKAKQAVGGVQLTRLSFPPTCELEVVKQCITDAVEMAYPQ